MRIITGFLKFLQNIFSDAFCFDNGGCSYIEGVGVNNVKY